MGEQGVRPGGQIVPHYIQLPHQLSREEDWVITAHPTGSWITEKRGKVIVLIAITLVAAFFRLHRIGSLPPGDRYDPAFYGVDALRVLSGERPIFFYDWVGQHKVEPLFSYLVALCFLIVGPSTLGIHLAAALVGIVTIPAVYWAAEVFFASLPGDDGLLRAMVRRASTC